MMTRASTSLGDTYKTGRIAKEALQGPAYTVSFPRDAILHPQRARGGRGAAPRGAKPGSQQEAEDLIAHWQKEAEEWRENRDTGKFSRRMLSKARIASEVEKILAEKAAAPKAEEKKQAEEEKQAAKALITEVEEEWVFVVLGGFKYAYKKRDDPVFAFIGTPHFSSRGVCRRGIPPPLRSRPDASTYPPFLSTATDSSSHQQTTIPPRASPHSPTLPVPATTAVIVAYRGRV
ncbi:hypothetical protein NM208_g15848 [Fusarium decemcellulare]|uniref:Uncharacterized protein n=1 Tax=Fusarium decemcellulare TaxID=57161 RepID=A0ACC1RDQ3_9HYPO|nr:hypothetical protein NM208_g15848 [Fusarium decemcellulare]